MVGLFLLQKEKKFAIVVTMKKLLCLLLLVLAGCAHQMMEAPEGFLYEEIETKTYRLASWQKMTDKRAPVRIYIEGDGYSFNHNGQATGNPTPKGHFVRDLAFNDPNPNVVYLARPCQYVEDEQCTYSSFAWTTGRFSKAAVDSVGEAVETLAAGRPVVLIGYSGGAMISGLTLSRNPNIDVLKWITIAGVLNHKAWTTHHKVRPLVDSLDMKAVPNVTQMHFVGERDSVVPPALVQQMAPEGTVYIVPNASHSAGYEAIYPQFYK